MSTIILIGCALLALAISFFKDRVKTKKSMGMAKGMLFKTAWDIIGVLAIVGLILALLPESLIQELLGNSNTFLSGIYGALIGTVTIIPAFIAFPLSSSLVKSGANLVAISAFMPQTSTQIAAQLGIEDEFKFSQLAQWGGLKPGMKISKHKPLFPRIPSLIFPP